MGDPDTGVHNVGTDSLAAGVVVRVGARSSARVGEAGKTPSGTILGDVGVDAHHGVLLDVVNLRRSKLAQVTPDGS